MNEPQQTEKQQNTLLWCTLFAFFVSGGASQLLGPLLPFLRESYGLSYDLSGILLSCQSVGNLVAVLLTGFLPFWVGRRRSVLITSVWMAVAFAIFTAGLGTPPLLIAAFLMVGFARGGNSNFSNTMISTLPGDKATRGYNLLHGAFAMGALLTPLLLVAVMGRGSAGSWRWVTGVLLVFCVAQLLVYVKMPLPPEHGKKEGGSAFDLGFLKNLRFWLGGAMLFFYLSAEYAITGWLVTYFRDTGILPQSHAQMTNSLLWLVMFIGRMAGAWLTGRVSRNKLLVVDGVGMFAFFLLMFFGRSEPQVLVGLTGVGLFMATIYTTAFSIGSECVKGNDLGCSVMILTGTVGGVITPAAVGLVAETSGMRTGMAVVVLLSGLLLCSILISVFLSRRKAAE